MEHKKMYKSGKLWVAATIVSLGLGMTVQQDVKADTTTAQQTSYGTWWDNGWYDVDASSVNTNTITNNSDASNNSENNKVNSDTRNIDNQIAEQQQKVNKAKDDLSNVENEYSKVNDNYKNKQQELEQINCKDNSVKRLDDAKTDKSKAENEITAIENNSKEYENAKSFASLCSELYENAKSNEELMRVAKENAFNTYLNLPMGTEQDYAKRIYQANLKRYDDAVNMRIRRENDLKNAQARLASLESSFKDSQEKINTLRKQIDDDNKIIDEINAYNKAFDEFSNAESLWFDVVGKLGSARNVLKDEQDKLNKLIDTKYKAQENSKTDIVDDNNQRESDQTESETFDQAPNDEAQIQDKGIEKRKKSSETFSAEKRTPANSHGITTTTIKKDKVEVASNKTIKSSQTQVNNAEGKKIANKQIEQQTEILPQTGNKNSMAVIALGAAAAMFGLGIATKRRKF